MKSLFKFFIIIFSLFLTLLLEQPSLQAHSTYIQDYITHTENNSVILVSNNLYGDENLSIQGKNNQNLLGTTPNLIALYNNDNSYSKINPISWERFIHNLSTNKQKVHQIRAP